MRRPVHLLFPKGLEVSFALTSLGWDERFAAEFSPYADTHVVGRVARVDRGAADIITVDNPVRVALRAADEQPAVGDWVALAATADRRWVGDVVLPRRP